MADKRPIFIIKQKGDDWRTDDKFWHQVWMIGGLILVDQLTKFAAQSQDLIVINTGVSFGILSHSNKLLILLSLVFIYLLYFFRTHLTKVAFDLLLAGSLSNLLDRAVFGGVRDWIDIRLFNLTNNVADLAIFVAVLLMLFDLRPKGAKEK